MTKSEANEVRADILADIAAKKITAQEGLELLNQLDREQNPPKCLTCKVSPKGAISVYGLQRMPITLYAEQWERLLDGAPKDHFVLVFIRAHEGKPFHGKNRDGEYVALIERKNGNGKPNYSAGPPMTCTKKAG